METNLEIKIDSTLPIITGNFDELEQALAEELKQFDLIVDEGSTKTAKAMATQINKMSKTIDTLRKEEVARLSAPIKEFEAKAKKLSSMCQESKQKILSQVKVFDEKQIEKVKKLLKAELESTYIKYGVEDEFKVVQVSDLAILSNLTVKSISKKAKDAIDDRVLETKRFQEKISNRLLTLETICYKGGLDVPLTRENINHFLMESNDDIYLEKLVSLIKNEISRLELANKIKREQEVAKTVKVVPPTQITTPITTQTIAPVIETSDSNSKYAHLKNAQAFGSTKCSYMVTATFNVKIDKSESSKLGQMLLIKFAKGGFKQIPMVTVEEVHNVA